MRNQLIWCISAATFALASPALALEVYYCEDGRQLKVDNSNRHRMASDPCVKAWFETTRENRAAWRRHAFLHEPALRWYGCCWSSCYSGFVVYYWRRRYYY